MAVKIKSVGGVGLRRTLEQLQKTAGVTAHVNVGFLEGSTTTDGQPLPAVAAYNEFGTDKIPPRPFMRNTVANNQARWGELLGAALKATGFQTHQALAECGEKITTQMQDEIIAMRDPPNATSTIKEKGFDNPLIDTGRTLNSVESQVKDGASDD